MEREAYHRSDRCGSPDLSDSTIISVIKLRAMRTWVITQQQKETATLAASCTNTQITLMMEHNCYVSTVLKTA